TADTLFQVDKSFGAFSGRELSVSTAGKMLVLAEYADQTAVASITARIKILRIDGSLPPSTPSLFDGSDSGLAPQIVYPSPDAIMPRNLGDFEIHWTDSHGNDVFEVSLHTEFADVRVYVPGGNGLPAQGPMASWAAFQASEWLAAVGQESTVTYRVRGASSTAPAGPGAAPAQTVKLSNQTMDGGLYYWAATTTGDAIGTFRHDMTTPGQAPDGFLTTAKTDGHCIGCHVLSRDGGTMAITYQDLPGAPVRATMVDVATTTIAPQVMLSTFGAFT